MFLLVWSAVVGARGVRREQGAVRSAVHSGLSGSRLRSCERQSCRWLVLRTILSGVAAKELKRVGVEIVGEGFATISPPNPDRDENLGPSACARKIAFALTFARRRAIIRSLKFTATWLSRF